MALPALFFRPGIPRFEPPPIAASADVAPSAFSKLRAWYTPTYNAKHRSYDSWWAPVSFFSIASVLSTASLLCIGSILSWASVGSLLSVFSVGSTLSIASVGSVLSIGSIGCNGMILTDCTRIPEANTEFHIAMSKATYDTMAGCSKKMYEQYQLDDSYETECDYKTVTCRYVNRGVTPPYDTGEKSCEVRRKGSSSWRDMDEKPSFKVKNIQSDVEFDGNDWSAQTMTLNNMMQPGQFYQTWSEIDAYETFRQIGKKAVPRARYTSVYLTVDGAIMDVDRFGENLYAMTETIGDEDFMNKHFENEWSLYEIEAGVSEFDTSSNSTIDDSGGDLSDHTLVTSDKTLALPLHYMDEMDAIRYYIGEEVTGHWDGACMNGELDGLDAVNNVYVGYEYTTEKYTLIPSGLDNTFQGCLSQIMFHDEKPVCPFMRYCLEVPTCRAQYEAERARVKAMGDRGAIRVVKSCAEEISPFITFGVVVLPVSIAVVYFVCRRVRARYRPV